MKHNFIFLGQKVLSLIASLGGLTVFVVQSFYQAFIPPYNLRRIFVQAKNAGVDSLPIVSLVSFFIGVIMALQTAYQMQRLGSEMYIASIVAVSLVRELGPVITALIIAGRVGAAFAAEIGSMQVTEQIDALETLASNPLKYLVVPRFIALALMLPILTIYADMIGIIGGHLICVHKLGISSGMYWRLSFQSLAFRDLFTGLSKTVFFGMLIAFISSYEGFNVQGGAEGVGRATTRAVVFTFIAIIIADCFFAVLFNIIMP